MKNYLKYSVWIFFLLMITANVYIFVTSMHLSDEINKYEKNTITLHDENQQLEDSVYKINSLQYAQKVAPVLNFTTPAKPIYLGEPNYALKL